jgi:hypothetical protein
MTIVERTSARHAVLENIEHVATAAYLVRQVGAGYHGLDAGQRLSGAGVDLANIGMGMRRAQNHADELPGCRSVRAIARAPGDLVDAIGARNAGTDDLELLIGETGVV